MGDARRLKKKYMGPGHPWQKERIQEEKKLISEYGLKNKKEIWKLSSKLKNFANIAKNLIAATGAQAEKEQDQLFSRLKKLGLVNEEAKLDDILSLSTQDIMERRLQTLVFRKGLSRTMKQARQFITHNHITIGDKRLSIPGYLVTVSEESQLSFRENTKLANESHPERTTVVKEIVKEDKAEKSENKKPAKKTETKTASKTDDKTKTTTKENTTESKVEAKKEEVKTETEPAKTETKTVEIKTEDKKESKSEENKKQEDKK